MTEFTALFPFCGLGAGARGFLDAEAHLLGARGRFRSLGGIDVDAEACADFERLTGSPALCADVATLTPAELRAFAGPASPDVVFGSPPCKGFSGLLSSKASKAPKYQALNNLVTAWLELVLAAWDEPPALMLLENVPRIKSRGAPLLKRVRALLRSAGYVLHEQTHDCGALGGLAQHRVRYLLVARHPRRCPPILYQPPLRRVRGCGEVLELLPMPGDPAAGPMHRLPRISWLNWVRLALIPAGGDWRDLPGVLLEGQARREQWGRHGVADWSAPTGAVAGPGSNGVEGVADPRLRGHVDRVSGWSDPVGTITHSPAPSSGAPAVADPRWHKGVGGVLGWDQPSGTITGNGRPLTGPFSVADPRLGCEPRSGAYGVLSWQEPSPAVIGAERVDNARAAVADPRGRNVHDHCYRVLRWDEPSFTIASKTSPGCGAYQVADPRADQAKGRRFGVQGLLGAWDGDPRQAPPFVPVIVAADGTWHRPLTTLELAALQGLPTTLDGRPLELTGEAVSRWRERIGNAVPVQAAEAIAGQMLIALLEAQAGAFSLQAGPVWVAPEVTP